MPFHQERGSRIPSSERAAASGLRRHRSCGLLLGGLLVFALASEVAAQPQTPRLAVTADPEVAAAARQVAALDPRQLLPAVRLMGLADPGPPIAVRVAAESSPEARSAPPWASGYADGAAGAVVLLPARLARYPDRGLEELVQHEIAHVLLWRASGGLRPVPRWFDEGMAMTASRGQVLEDHARVALAILIDGSARLTDLDAAFRGGRGQVQAAYALAGDFVADLLRRYGSGTGAAILREMRRGASFDNAFAAVVGRPLADVEAGYWKRRTFWNRWVPLLTSTATLWSAITVLALVAFRRRRERDEAIRRRWEAEEESGRHDVVTDDGGGTDEDESDDERGRRNANLDANDEDEIVN